MKVIVTGALGFVGINVLRDLALVGHEVVGVDVLPRDRLAAAFLEPARGAGTIIADIAVDDFSKQLPDNWADVLVHAAAVTPLGEFEHEQAALAANVNVAGTARIMAWAVRAGIRRVVHVSTGSVYGPVDGDAPVMEDSPLRPEGVYGITKSAGDQLARRLASLSGTSLRVVRLSHVYGPMERPSAVRGISSPIERWTRAIIAGQPIPPPRPEVRRDFVHVTDVAKAIELLATHDAEGAFNVSSGVHTSEDELVEGLRELEPSLPIARDAPEAVSSPRRPPLSIDRIHHAVGWRPSIGLHEGLRSYLEWRRASGG